MLFKEFSDCIENTRKVFKSVPKNCHHKYNALNNDIENFVQNNEANAERTMKLLEKQTQKVKENAEKYLLLQVQKENGSIGIQICFWRRSFSQNSSHMELEDT